MSDLQYALRGILRAPAFTAVAVLSLALGIGANVTIYTIANFFLDRPIAGASRTDELVRVYRGRHSPMPAADIAYLRREASTFADIAGEDKLNVGVTTGDATEQVSAALVTDGYFPMLGVRPQAGRLLGAIDSASSDAVVISDAMFRRRFQGDPGIVGSRIRINDAPFTIVGVAPREFVSSQSGWSSDIWFPPAAAPALIGMPLENSGGSMYVTGRLRPGATIAQANADVATLAARLVVADSVARRNFSLRVDHARGITAEIRPAATAAAGFLLAVVGLVLLIACANVANLLLARATARRREIGVRIALGAGRWRLARQMLIESALLAAIAGVAGVIAARWLADALAQFIMSRSPEPIHLTFDTDVRVLGFTLALVAVTTLLFGLLPALRATSPGTATALREDAPQTSGRSRTRSTLVGVQVALCTVLLACATLFLRSLANTRDIEPGFDASGVADLPIDVSTRRLDTAGGRVFFQRVLERARALPGVSSATIAAIGPLSGSNMGQGAWTEGSAADAAGGRAPYAPYFNVVDLEYFRTLGIAIVQGRPFSHADDANAPAAVIVNEQMARTLWPGESALGKRVSVSGPAGPWVTVVGVAKNTKYNSLGEDTPPFMYLPFAQNYRPHVVLHARVTDGVEPLRRALPAIVRDIDPLLPPSRVTLLTEDMRVVLLPAQLAASLLGGFGTLALLLATLGIYGVVSYSVAQRTREFGIRSALGATGRDVVRLVLRQSMRTVVIGAAIGLLLALGVARLLASQLYGVRPTDPATFIAMPAFLILVAAAATLLPARRATRVPPIEALRAE